jgi:hypothetical protein
MTQTTNAKSFIKARVFISPDNSAWTAMSSHGASIAISGGERVVGAQNTMDGDVPIVKAGKRGPIQVTCRYAYTETDTEPFDVLTDQHETEGGPLYCQYTIDNSLWFKTGLGVLERPGYPGGDASSGEVILSEFVMSCVQLSRAAAST